MVAAPKRGGEDGMHPSDSFAAGVNLPTDWKRPRRLADGPSGVITRAVGQSAENGEGGVHPSRHAPPLKLKTTLPCEYIFPPNRTKYLQWPVHKEPSAQSRRIGSVMLNHRFKVMAIQHPWARIRLPGGAEGWSPMSVNGKWYLFPYNADLHSELKPLKRLPKQRSPPRPKSKTVLSMLFGTRNDPIPAKVAGSAGRVRKTRRKSRVIVYTWQRRRGEADRYAELLETRRQQLRSTDLSKDKAALQEWMELIKELDVVLRYNFRTKLPPRTDDVRKPRSNSFLLPPSSSATTEGTADAVKDVAAGTQAEPHRRKRSNSFVDTTTSADHTQGWIPPSPPTVASKTEGSAVAAAPAAAAATSPLKMCKHGNDPSNCKYGACAAARSVPATAPVQQEKQQESATATTSEPIPSASGSKPKMCKHGNVPGNCKYGSCAQQATSTDGTTSTPKRCKHGGNPETCPYGTCASARLDEEIFEALVQEEMARLKESALGDSTGDSSVPAASNPATAVKKVLEPSQPTPRPACHIRSPTSPQGEQSNGTGGLALTGARRTVRKKVKTKVRSSVVDSNLVKRKRVIVRRPTPHFPDNMNATPSAPEGAINGERPQPKQLIFDGRPGSPPKSDSGDSDTNSNDASLARDLGNSASSEVEWL